MSVVMDNGAVDGYALVMPLLDSLGLRVDQVTAILIEPVQVTVNYLRLNEDGNKFIVDGDVAASRLTLPLDWTRKP